jgi:trk/ktr system potassium uptake protein
MKKEVLIVGGGKVGRRLASLLIETGHVVRVVESDGYRAETLERKLAPNVVVHGSGTDPSVLEAAGVRACGVVAAVTGADEVNLVVTALARFTFGVDRTVARVNDPHNTWMFQPDMGVDAAVDQAELLSHLIAEEMSLGDMTILLALRRGSYSLVEERVGGDAPAVGGSLADLDLPKGCVLLAVIRDGGVIAAHGDLVIQPADEVLALVHADVAHELAAMLA